MLSYQHSFHAGNHADVLKHVTLCAILSKLVVKPKPFFYLDTHAGSAGYEIEKSAKHDSVTALKMSVNDSTPDLMKTYISLVETYLTKSLYPGSPLIAEELLSSFSSENESIRNALRKSNLQLNELHPNAFETLRKWMKPTDFHCHNRDAFEILKALTPPKPNRGVILIDPPYEQIEEYSKVVHSVSNAIKKWSSGIYCIWYPLLSPERVNRITDTIEDSPKHGLSEEMLLAFTDIAKSANIGLLSITFANQTPSSEIGMYGSGMAIFNPPWKIETSLNEILDYLTNNVKIDTNELSSIKWLAAAP